MRKQLIKLAFALMICGHCLLAQNNLERVNLNFSLNGLPTNQAVEFDNPKSYWKVSYRFSLIDDETLNRDIVPIEKMNFNAKIRKRGVLIQKGNIIKRPLLEEQNREIIVRIILDEKIKKLLSSGKPFSFLFRIKTHIYSPILKRKIKVDQEFPARLEIEMQENRTLAEVSMGASINIERGSDGNFSYSIFRN